MPPGGGEGAQAASGGAAAGPWGGLSLCPLTFLRARPQDQSQLPSCERGVDPMARVRTEDSPGRADPAPAPTAGTRADPCPQEGRQSALMGLGFPPPPPQQHVLLALWVESHLGKPPWRREHQLAASLPTTTESVAPQGHRLLVRRRCHVSRAPSLHLWWRERGTAAASGSPKLAGERQALQRFHSTLGRPRDRGRVACPAQDLGCSCPEGVEGPLTWG